MNQPLDVLARVSAAVWATALFKEDPVKALNEAQEFAADLIARVMLRAGPGRHLVTCVTKQGDAAAGLHVSLPISCTEKTAEIRDSIAEQAFGAVLMLGHLAREPVGLLMRSCPDDRHDAPGHPSTIRGWLVLDGYARPLKQAAIQAVACGSTGPDPGSAPHQEAGVGYETAFSLYQPEGWD
jgi:hypothetical protein